MKRNHQKQEGNYGKLLQLFVGLCVVAFVAVAAIVIYVDPFFHYHKPLKQFPYLVDNQLSQNPGMAKHMEYDSVLLGSSMTVNFNTNWFKELLDLNTLKLSYSGAFPKDQSNIMEVVFASDHEVKTVFLGIDVITYTGGITETKYPIPEYLYDDSVWNDLPYLLNKDVLLNYILRPLADPDPTDLATMYASWWTDEYYNEDWVLQNYTSPEKALEEIPPEVFVERTKHNLDVNICPYIEDNPETEFVVFFPPYSILFWNNVLQENHLEATLAVYRYITNRLLSYDNVQVFFFPDREDIVLDLNHYADYNHYHPRYNRFMTECFADGTGQVKNQEDIDKHLTQMRQMVEAFDFEALLQQKER